MSQMASARGLDGMGAAVNSTSRRMDEMRGVFSNVMNASKQYEVRQVKTISLADDYSRRLKEQKVSMFEAMRSGKLMNQVIKDQISLQRAQAVAWRKDASGRTTADLVMPKEGIRAIDNARVSFGVLNQAVASGADHMVKWGKNTQWAGRQLTVGFTVPLGMAAAATGKLAYEMDRSLTNITKVYGDATTAFQDSSESIRATAMQTAQNMAMSYGQSAKDTLEMEAQFAAAGKTGAELQEATAAATKARMLNEIDLQTAIQASITMQTVYGSSSKELGDTWNYINAIANQTVLGAEDFAIAIPKVAGLLKELGAGPKELGVMMTAFKAAGVDAAEGANSLKTISFRAVSAYGKGLETFTKMTGQNLNQIVEETNGETIPTLLRMYDAMKNLSTPQRIAVVKDVFGIYQGNKAMILMEQLAEKGDQVSQAMAVGDNSIAENAKIANQELKRMNDQPFKQIQKAIETIKIQMANLGKSVLPVAAGFLGFIQNFLKFIDGLSSGQKKMALIIAAVIGIAGPLTMLLGLFANLSGNVIKLFSSFGTLITRFKIIDAAERAQILLAKQATNGWDSQTSAVARLVQELQIYNTTLANANALNAGAAKPAPGPQRAITPQTNYITKTDSLGRKQSYQYDEAGKMSRISAAQAAALDRRQLQLGREMRTLEQINIEEQQRIAILQEQALVMNANMQKRLAISRNIGMGAAAAGGGAMMLSSNETINKMGMMAMVGGSLLSLFPQVGVSIVKNLVAPFRLVGPVGTTALKNLGSSVLGFAKSAALPMAAVAIGAMVYWDRVRDATKKAVAEAEAYNNVAMVLGEQNSVNWNSAVGMPEASGTGDQATVEFAAKLKQSNKAAADALVAMAESVNKNVVDSGEKTGNLWGIAIAKGVEVKLHGGTEDAAKQATRTALEVMGKSFSDAEFESTINMKVNFENADDLINKQMDTIKKGLKVAAEEKGSGMQGFNRNFLTGQNDLTEDARKSVDKMGADFFNMMRGINDPTKRQQVLNEFITDTTGDLKKTYDELVAKNSDLAKKNGKVMSFGDFLKSTQIYDDTKKQNLQDTLNLTQDQAEAFQRSADGAMRIAQAVAVGSGEMSQSTAEGTIYDPAQLKAVLARLLQIEAVGQKKPARAVDLTEGYAKMHEDYGLVLDKAAQRGHKLSDAEKLIAINIIRANNGMAAAIDLAQGFNYAQVDAANSTLTLAEAIDKLQMKTSEEQVTGAYRSAMEGVNSDMFEAASSSFQKEGELAQDALQNQMDGAMKVFDNRSDALDKAYDNRQKSMDSKQKAEEKAMDARFDAAADSMDKRYDTEEKKLDARHNAQDSAMDKRWETKKKTEAAYYDNRIDGVQKLIDSEQAAEDIRQKIFEAEKSRIQRMSEMYNRNIDFNMALNSGNLDEAAKIGNDMQAQTETWQTEDTASVSQSSSDTRVSALEKQKTQIESAKDARLEAIDAVEKREREALKSRQQIEDESLRIARDGAKKRLDTARNNAKEAMTLEHQLATDSLATRRKNAQDSLATERSSSQQVFETKKKNSQAWYAESTRTMERELTALRAYIPRNNAELVAQRNAIEAVYKKYGVKLTDHGKSWSGIIGRSLTTNVSTSANQLKTSINWASIGSTISNALLKGGMGMTASQFGSWLNGGTAPKGTLFAPKASTSTRDKAYGDGYGSGITRHKGGIINDSKGSRAGHSGKGLSQSEVMVRALKGESVLNRRATDVLGAENIDAINKGKLPANTGPWDMRTSGMAGLSAAIAAGATKRIMGQAIQAVAQRKMLADAGMDFGTGAVAAKAGSFGGIQLSQEQLQNAASIVGVGKSLGATQRDLVIALMTAMQESTLRNLDYGDRDSLGLFQQRAAWGSAADRTNPAKSARMFFTGGAQGQRGLFDFPNRAGLTPGQAAQAVQVSAFPDAYEKWQAMAAAVLGGTGVNSVATKGTFGSGINMAQYGFGSGASSSGGWTMPAKGMVTSRYGMRVNPVTGIYKLHAGSDIGAASGSSIYAARSGRVVSAGGAGGYGNYTVIDHGQGLRTAYAHQSSIGVSPGQMVQSGQVIGRVGTTGNSTGPHLHFEYMKDGVRTNPNTIIPQLSKGGYTMNTGLANLHPKETVLTAPLTEQLHEGLGRFAKGDNSKYNITMDFRGAVVDKDVDIQGKVEKAIQNIERRKGSNRRIGG